MKNSVGRPRATRRPVVSTVVVTICAALGLGAVSAPALAKKPAKKPKAAKITTHTPVTPGSGYLALGDSVTFGYEEQQVVPAPNYHDPTSFLAYPELLGSELHLTVANAACPGETSTSLIDDTAGVFFCENPANGYRPNFPLHVSYSGSQLDYAVSYLKKHQNVRLVSLMIGANDLFACQAATADKCASLTEEGAVLGTLSKNVKTIVSAIRNKAHYGGQLAIVNYYSLDYSNQTSETGAMALNQTVDTAAKPFHVEIADGFGEFGAGTGHSGGNICTAGLVTQLSTGGCGIHPSYAGQSLLAQALEKAIHLG
jgi:lysophospholipase L1-like esterase